MKIKILDIDKNKIVKEEEILSHNIKIPRIGELIEIPTVYDYRHSEGHPYSNKCGRIIDIIYKPESGAFVSWFRIDADTIIEVLCKFSEPYIAKGKGKNDTKYE